MVKKAVITVILVEESIERTNEELRKEIFDALAEAPAKIPWMKDVDRVEILEN